MCRLVTAVLLFLVVVVAASSSSPKLKVNGLVLLPFQRSNETSFRMLEDAESIVGGGGSTWVSLVVSFKQENINSTTIVLDDDLQLVQDTIQLAKNNGMSVIVKPHVDLANDPLHWRGEIGKFFNSSDWTAWFLSYQALLTSVAAVSTKADVLNIGTELSLAQTQEAQWRQTISLVRNHFKGLLTYGANHNDESTVKWWDAIDWIGVDAYYPLGNDSSVDALVISWQKIFSSILEPLSSKYNKPIIFTEVGYQSVTGAAITPWAAHGSLSIATQERCYIALYIAARSAKFPLIGVQWWALTDLPQDGGGSDTGFSMHNKPSATVIQQQGAYNRRKIKT